MRKLTLLFQKIEIQPAEIAMLKPVKTYIKSKDTVDIGLKIFWNFKVPSVLTGSKS